MKTNQSRIEVTCIFDNRHMEIYYKDGSILAWKGQHIVFLSQQGFKNTFTIHNIQRHPELKMKFSNAISLLNTYSNSSQYHVFNTKQHLTIHENSQNIDKNIKITYFEWDSPSIEQTPIGFQMHSDDKCASLCLHHNLYIVEVQYYQYMGIVSGTLPEIPNYTKQLLTKYNYEYTEIPVVKEKQESMKYRYVKVKKVYSIFDVPELWRYPLSLIWSSLLEYKIIPHQFCYIDYPQNELKSRTCMPQVVDVMEKGESTNEKLNIPLLGRPNHQDKCRFILIQSNSKEKDCLVWYMKSDESIMYDGNGFWFVEASSFYYKSRNKIQHDYKTHINTIPLTLRLENQPPRSIKFQLEIYATYKRENSKKLSLAKDEKAQFDREANLIHEETIQNVGNFKAYSNGLLVAKFNDRTLLTLNSKKMEIKLIDSFGNVIMIGLHHQNNYNYNKYKEYIEWVVECQERIFYREEWKRKRELSGELECMMEANEALLRTFDLYR